MSRLMNTVDFRTPVMVSAEGCRLVDENNVRYIDFFTDVGTASMGYDHTMHARALEMLLKSSSMTTHAPNLYRNRLRDGVSEQLCQMTEMDKVFWCNSGSEAVEAAIKMARKFQWARGDRKRTSSIYTYRGGFHGRTMGALSAGDGPKYHTEGFGPMLEGFGQFKSINEIPTNCAAVMLAPVFGNNDVRVYPGGWLDELREYTAKHGILLIFDEVQTGAGRTGAITYAQRIGVLPDIMTLAKGIGMGCPVGLTLARGEVANTFTPGTHFSTFGGNPLACTYVKVMLDWLSKAGNLEEVRDNGEIISNRLNSVVGNARGVGMLIACDVGDCDRMELEQSCLEEGLILPSFRPGPGTVKITPPLNIEHADLMMGLHRFETAYRKTAKSPT